MFYIRWNFDTGNNEENLLEKDSSENLDKKNNVEEIKFTSNDKYQKIKNILGSEEN